VTFLKGFGIGAAVAAPVGPMSLLCVRRTLAQGWRFGMGTGAGIAAGDALYALTAALGLAGVMRFIAAHERPLHLAAALFLMYLGWRTFFAPAVPTQREPSRAASVLIAFGSALLLTLTNPPTILSFVAIFAALAPSGFGASGALTMVGGVFAGSLAWWLFVTALVSAFRHALGPRTRRWIDRLSGAVLGMLGAVELRRAA
jgi:threonine/homoserine/homoserine lactone efflux protein